MLVALLLIAAAVVVLAGLVGLSHPVYCEQLGCNVRKRPDGTWEPL